MKKIFNTLLIGLVMLAMPKLSVAQNAKFKMADKYYQSFDYTMSGNIYRDIVSGAKYANDTTALRRLAIGEFRLGKLIDAEGYFKSLIKLNVAKESDLLLLADVLKMQGKYPEAITVYEKIAALNPNNDIAKRHIENPGFATMVSRDSAIYTLKNSVVNSEASDFAPGFFIDRKMIFSSARGDGASDQRMYHRTEQPYLNIYYADIASDSSLKDPKMIEGKMNSRYHEGTMTFIPGDNSVYFTRNNYLNGTVNKSKKEKLELGIFVSKYDISANTWGELTAFPHNNSEYSVGHPTINASRTKIYFVSDMPGGQGGTDIYYCEKQGETWGAPINLGNKINTSGDEMFPFMVSDSVMYFSSNGQLSLGGLDLYYTNPSNDSPILNAGYPASTRADDFALVCYPEETVGFFCSTRKGGKGGDDIYEFRIEPVDTLIVSGTAFDMETMQPIAGVLIKVPTEDGSTVEVLTDANGGYTVRAPYKSDFTVEGTKQGYLPATGKAKPNPRSSYLEHVDLKLQKYDAISSGRVLYAENNAAAVGALIQLIEISGNDSTVVDSLLIDKKGTYQFPLYKKKNYSLLVTQEGYARQTASFNTNNPSEKTFTRDFKLFKPKVGEVVRLDNIYYDYNSAVIRSDAALELNKLVQILKDNPTMKIELSSHSDSRGGDKYNLDLSDKRAKAAVAYIISQGISADRLYGKGYGELKILNHCKNDVKCTDEEHQFNRRTEFTITAF